MKIKVISFLILIFIVITCCISYNYASGVINKYTENISGTVFKHFKENAKDRTICYLFVDTDKYGRQQFIVNTDTYVSYNDNDKITLIDIDTFNYRKTNIIEKIEYHGSIIFTMLIVVCFTLPAIVCFGCLIDNNVAIIISQSEWYNKYF